MKYEPRAITDTFALHCSDTPPSMHVGEVEIRRWHLERGWADIGYNIVIRRSGRTEIGRPLDYRGAHVAGFNHRALGICLVGGRAENSTAPEDNFTPRQFDALADTLRFCWWIWPGARVVGHREFPGVAKACPVFSIEQFLQRYGFTRTGLVLTDAAEAMASV